MRDVSRPKKKLQGDAEPDIEPDDEPAAEAEVNVA